MANDLNSADTDKLLSMLAWGEARGEGPVGMLAVLSVVQNRSARTGRSWRDVALQRKQFSCFNGGYVTARLWGAAVSDPLAWQSAQSVVELFMRGLTRDPTMGATHFFNPHVVLPRWARPENGWRQTVTIGRHVFGIAA